ncbi:hypothetical protein WMY93_009695 [Mugilogobius chulae]|uniref:Immunoglobulin V-set domain-containing protein n=1 Tax=Mugilogobius chulae TaxID=88201 RepID=A0AAW0PFM1_9GOBI
MLVLAILVLSPGLSYGFWKPGNTMCKAIESTHHTCSVTQGGNAFLQVITNASGLQVHFKKQFLTGGSEEVLTIKKGELKIRYDSFRNRTEAFMDNGTIKIQNVKWEDAGKYNVEIFHSNGTHINKFDMTLEVKANPWPYVVFACSSVGAFLVIVLISVCICRKVKARKQPGAVI